jgi:hypothetical protein
MLWHMDMSHVEEPQVHSMEVVRRILPFRERLADQFGTSHGNASLQLIDVVIAMLAGFFNPLVRSQRLIEALSEQQWMQGQTSVARIPRSTFSDAVRRFDPQSLRPLIQELTQRIPALATRDADLAGITRQVLAADGSYFNLAGEVAWALANRRGNTSKLQSRVRLNLQLDVQQFAPVDCDISGREDASEAAAFQRNLKSGVIYLVDRGFVHFGFIQAVLDKGSNLVLRLRKDVGFCVHSAQDLTARDAELDVRSDDLGVLTGPTSPSNQGRATRTAQAPSQTLRRVVIWDPVKKESVLLLTDLLDVPAYVIALLYRKRWQIEICQPYCLQSERFYELPFRRLGTVRSVA